MDTFPMHYLSFDTETTGFGPSAKIVELSVVYFTNGQVVEEWEQLFWPGDIDWEKAQGAFDVNGLSREKLLGKPTFGEAKNEIVDRLKGEKIWVAHNTPFDMGMLQQEFDQLNTPMPEPAFALDTMMLDAVCDKYRKGSRKLDAVARVWGVAFEGDAHRAAADTMVCGKVLWAILQSGKLPPSIEIIHQMQLERRKDWNAFIKRKYKS